MLSEYGSLKLVKLKAKQAIRDAARVLGLSFSSGDKVAKLMPPMILGMISSPEAAVSQSVIVTELPLIL